MKKVECEIEEDEIEGDDGGVRPGVRATCSECDHVTESFGLTERSIKRCLMLMRDECPLGQENFYVDGDE